MPEIEVVLFREDDGTVPLLEWFARLPQRAQDKCRVRIERLAALGHELKRPGAGYLEDGIHELRAKHAGVNYRMLYFFHRRTAVVLSHGFSKQRARVPTREIRRAIQRRDRFRNDPRQHTHVE